MTFYSFFLCKNRRKNEYLKFIGMIILIVIGIILIEPMMRVISKLPVISFYFNKYNDTYNAYSLTHYVVHSVFRLPLAFILLIYNKKIIEKNNKNLVIIICPFIDFIFIFMSKVIRWTIRMTYFTMAAMPLSIMLIGSNDEIKDRDKKLVIFLLIITLILRFIALFGYADYDGIIPYQFSF
ncbi:MAG: EpsG family protein [[Clostridium] symbiosum]